MEAYFHHWIKYKKGKCDFLSHNYDFFSQLRVYILPFWLYISQFWLYNLQLWIYDNSEKKKKKWDCDLYLAILT